MENQFKSIRQAESNRFASLIRIIIFLFVGNGDAFYSASCIHKLDLTILLKLVTWLLWQLSIWYLLLTIMADSHQLDIACPSTELNWFVADCWWMSILDCVCVPSVIGFLFHFTFTVSWLCLQQNTRAYRIQAVAVWQLCELLYTCYLLTYLLTKSDPQNIYTLPNYCFTLQQMWVRSKFSHLVAVNRIKLNRVDYGESPVTNK